MRRYLRHFFSLIPMTVLAASVITTYFTRLWWLVPLGLLASGITTLLAARAERDQALLDAGEPEYDLARLTPRLRKRFQALLLKRHEILQALEELEDSPFLRCDEVAAKTTELVDSFYELLVKLDKLSPLLTTGSLAKARSAVEDLKVRVDNAQDHVTRENLRMALDNKTDELNRLSELRTYQKRIASQLANLVSALGTIHLRIVQLGLTSDTSMDHTPEITDNISDLIVEVEISEKVARELDRITIG